ncbi:DUF6089 family protein [Tenacibaculum maritimum]|nr:DUF6089 family protein [Tenacibaculum maritimum]
MKIIYLFILFAFTAITTQSQTHEVGFFVGGSNYVGDIGRTNYIYPNKIGGGLIYKHNLNPRIGLRATYSYIPVRGMMKNQIIYFEKIEASNSRTPYTSLLTGIRI